MPFDPTYPAADTPATSAPMRAQFQAVVDLIQSVPVGPVDRGAQVADSLKSGKGSPQQRGSVILLTQESGN